jgi:hypothetical protein
MERTHCAAIKVRAFKEGKVRKKPAGRLTLREFSVVRRAHSIPLKGAYTGERSKRMTKQSMDCE